MQGEAGTRRAIWMRGWLCVLRAEEAPSAGECFRAEGAWCWNAGDVVGSAGGRERVECCLRRSSWHGGVCLASIGVDALSSKYNKAVSPPTCSYPVTLLWRQRAELHLLYLEQPGRLHSMYT